MEKEIWHLVKVIRLGNSDGIVLDKKVKEFEGIERGDWLEIRIRKVERKKQA